MTDPIPGSAAYAIDPGSYAADLSPQRLRSVVERLAATEFTGRRVGTPGARAAAHWLAETLADLGATVTLDPIGEVTVRDVYATPTLRWSDGAMTRDLVHRRDFAEHLASADLPTTTSAPLVTPEANDVSGRWVLAPTYRDDDARSAGQAGAVGLLVPRGVDDGGWMPKMIAGPVAAAIPVISVRTDIHQAMSVAARTGVATVHASVPLRTETVGGSNIYGVFAEPDDGAVSVLLTAHYDGGRRRPGGPVAGGV